MPTLHGRGTSSGSTRAMPPARKKRAAPEPSLEPSSKPEPEGPPSKRLRGPAAATATTIRPPVPLLSVQQYVSVVNELLEMEAAAPFGEPLDYVLYNLPDYPKVVKHPMDLGTIQSKLSFGSYKHGEDVLKDVRRRLGRLHAYRIAHRTRTACAPHAHRMRTACAPHAHRMRTARTRCAASSTTATCTTGRATKSLSRPTRRDPAPTPPQPHQTTAPSSLSLSLVLAVLAAW